MTGLNSELSERKVRATKNGERRSSRKPRKRIELGEHIVADPEICSGKPTFKGTRIMVWQVPEDVADGRSWDFICNVRWAGRLPLTAVAEAVRPAQRALLDERGNLAEASTRAGRSAALA